MFCLTCSVVPVIWKVALSVDPAPLTRVNVAEAALGSVAERVPMATGPLLVSVFSAIKLLEIVLPVSSSMTPPAVLFETSISCPRNTPRLKTPPPPNDVDVAVFPVMLLWAISTVPSSSL